MNKKKKTLSEHVSMFLINFGGIKLLFFEEKEGENGFDFYFWGGNQSKNFTFWFQTCVKYNSDYIKYNIINL